MAWGEVVAGENAARPVDSIQPADPLGGFLDGALGDAPDLGPGRDTPCVMCLDVDEQDIPGVCHVSEHVAVIVREPSSWTKSGTARIETR